MKYQVEIIICGYLSPEWSAELNGLEASCLSDGNTKIAGSLPDQAAIFGLLSRLRDLGLSLVRANVRAVNRKGDHRYSG